MTCISGTIISPRKNDTNINQWKIILIVISSCIFMVDTLKMSLKGQTSYYYSLLLRVLGGGGDNINLH